ncbi:sensor histidine kinase [Amycolatopsis sp. H20-H5]|uniref:sensor histidine kinase n=1 Tax=Amycolatopsis sp. H20-H5 TaxID=3046309 RepID=UPI002DB902C3|nr:nitrate- and nitrite sensing domain-containing protein [Amycolatopsis sp. H20-H5]MEC3978381.1 nitrate- and nitrite sensing domain-containing protein [Amycolatopsis sp. H20-H5]
MLTIALVPSIVLLLSAFAVGGYLIYDAVHGRDFATKIRNSGGPSFPFFSAVQEERRLSLRELAGNKTEHATLLAQRDKTDAAAADVSANLQNFIGDAPASVQRNIAVLSGLLQKAPQLRQQIDAGQISQLDAFGYYNKIIDQFVDGLTGLAQDAPNAQNAFDRITAVPLFIATDQMQRADALAAAAEAGGGFTDENYRAFVTQVGAYRTQLDASVERLIPEVRAKYDQLIASDAWKTVTTVENTLLTNSKAKLPVPEDQWRAAAAQVRGGLSAVFVQQSANATNTAIDEADNTLLTSAIAAAIALLVAVAVFFFALRLSNRLIGRLARLREDTLDVAEVQLPELVARVRAGEYVDVEEGAYLLDHGDDEIGEVAKAFNKAQQTAVAAAVDEAKTREGTKAVFLNIAHRSQVIVHRQLKVLDQAERKQEDPDQLDTLFQLDHLSTRARRNAENLIILGGGQPGRQWRNPVSLTELVRGASAETEDFARVKTAKLPSIAVQGPVVGDLVHLLAELIDNATSFSPPQSRVEVRGNVVGKGVVIEVEDQGLGIEPEQGDQLNQMLADPPDFGIMALSVEPRLGLFVVARLAARHGISVHLRESAYGGTRAIVLVRSDLLSAATSGESPSGELPIVEPTPVLAEDNGAPVMPPVRPLRRARHRTEPPLGVPAPVSAAPPLPVDSAQTLPPRPPRPPRPEPIRPQQPAAQLPPAWPPQDTRQPQGGHPQQPSRPEAPGRPALPQRRRQQSLVPQLREDRPAAPTQEIRPDTPELARNRLSAFQQGTRRGREQEPEPQYEDLDINDGYGERE